MEKIPIDVRAPFRKSRIRGALSRAGRLTLVAIVLGLALIGFLHLTRGTAVRHVRGLTGHTTLLPQENGVAAAGLLYTAPTLGSTPAERFFALSIAGARKTLYITNSYFAPERSFIDLLAVAARRGVDVRILTAGARTDVNVVRHAGRASYDTLLRAGVRVFEWQPSTLHAKTFVADGQWSTIGSMNFDNRSMALNDESTLMILDPSIGRQMEQIFLDDLRYAQEITLVTFQQRSWWARLTERAAYFVMRLL